jgi:DNA-binding NarL/FixJ family response regulator
MLPLPLFERDRELESLAGLVEATTAGRGRCVLIEGPAGIGKSRLLAETRARGDGGLRVLAARAGELERDFPFGVVRQLFEGLVAQSGQRERLLVRAAAPAASVFGALDDAAATSADATFATLHGLFWLSLNLAEQQPLLLAIDDLHWCDRASLRFLAYLVRRLEDVPILVAATLRTAEPGVDAQLVGEIARDPATVSVHPRALSEHAVAALVRDRLGADAADAFCAACHDATAGNPLLLRQLLTALEVDGVRPEAANAGAISAIGPRAVARTVLSRLGREPAATIATARAIAVLGESATQPVVAALAGVGERELADATAALARAEILLPELPLRFVHPLVRDAVYRDLQPGRRELQHAHAAALLRDRGAADDEVAAQLLNAAPRGDAWVARLLHDAGRVALRRGAPDSAAAYMRRALDEPPPDDLRPALLSELGAAEALTSGAAAIGHLRGAYDALDDPAARALVAGLLVRALNFTGASEEGRRTARRAAAALPPDLADERLALEAVALMTIMFDGGAPEEFERLREHREPPPPGSGVGRMMMASMAAFTWACSGGDAAETTALAIAATADGTLAAADGGLLLAGAQVTLMMAGRDEALQTWDAAIEIAHRHGSLFAVASAHMWRGQTLVMRGDLAAAEQDLRSAVEEFGMWGFGDVASFHVSAFLANIARERGQLAQARKLLDGLGPVPEPTNSTGWWLGAGAELALAEGRPEAALELALRLGRHCDVLPDPLWTAWRGIAAQALDRLDRGEEAERMARDELDAVRAYGAPSAVGRSLRILGTIERERGIERLREAVATLATSSARLEHAKALAALGGALRRARRPMDAREPLREALDLAAVCDARALVEEVRGELRASGARPRSNVLSGPASLTPGERRVVDLAAAGEKNRAIAQTLYVTPKTVEVHLSNAYRKLGIRSRRELAAALADA